MLSEDHPVFRIKVMQIKDIPVIGKVLSVIAVFGLLTIGSTLYAVTQMQAIDG